MRSAGVSIQNDSGLPKDVIQVRVAFSSREDMASEAEEPSYERANHKGRADPGIGHRGAGVGFDCHSISLASMGLRSGLTISPC
jgi:hypothetical protein